MSKGGDSLAQNRRNSLSITTQLRLPYKGRAIKEFV